MVPLGRMGREGHGACAEWKRPEVAMVTLLQTVLTLCSLSRDS
jgi:hypothetical protein